MENYSDQGGAGSVKILLLSQYWYPENGVPQRRWTWLTKILIEDGHEVTVIAPPPHYQRKVSLKQWWSHRRSRQPQRVQPATGSSGERIVRSGFFPAGPSLTARILNQAGVAVGAAWAVWRRPGTLKDFKPDLVIGTVPALPTASVTQFAGKLFGAPYIIDLRDAWPDLMQESRRWNQSTGRTSARERVLRQGPLQLLTWFTRKAMQSSLKGASGILVTARYLEEDLRARNSLHKGDATPPIATVRNVFPVETEFKKIRHRTTDSSRLKVLYAGTMGRAQNLANALAAAAIARRDGVEVSIRFVGTGVTKPALQTAAEETGVDVRFEPRHDASDLKEFYEWADTALVHLTDWKPLDKTVPSKTYELMSVGIHISGVVSGEGAELIRSLGAGDVVDPEDPAALAQLWVELARNRDRLVVDSRGGDWVREQQTVRAPAVLKEIIRSALDEGRR